MSFFVLWTFLGNQKCTLYVNYLNFSIQVVILEIEKRVVWIYLASHHSGKLDFSYRLVVFVFEEQRFLRRQWPWWNGPCEETALITDLINAIGPFWRSTRTRKLKKMFYLQNKFPFCLDWNSFSEKDKKELKVTTRMNKIDWNDTSQTSHRWTDGWRP